MDNLDAIRAIVAELQRLPKPRFLILTPDGQIFATEYPLTDEIILEDRQADHG